MKKAAKIYCGFSLLIAGIVLSLALFCVSTTTVYATEYGATEDAPNASDQVTGERSERLEYLNVRGRAANDVYEGNARHTGFSLADNGVKLNKFSDSHFNHAYLVYEMRGGVAFHPDRGRDADVASESGNDRAGVVSDAVYHVADLYDDQR